nr:outer membrane protein assembly factor BamE [Echinimonas agarilytica]
MCLPGCSFLNSLVYKIDIPQGNFIDEKQVEKLRVGMTKEQVKFVLGTPMVNNAFNTKNWNYQYRYKTGKGQLIEKRLVAKFDENELLTEITGDYEPSEKFNVPIDEYVSDFDNTELSSDVVEEPPVIPAASKESDLWAIKVGEFSNAANVKRLRIQLEQAGYIVTTWPEQPAEGQPVSVFADSAETQEELQGQLEAIAELTKTNPIIAHLPQM